MGLEWGDEAGNEERRSGSSAIGRVLNIQGSEGRGKRGSLEFRSRIGR